MKTCFLLVILAVLLTMCQAFGDQFLPKDCSGTVCLQACCHDGNQCCKWTSFDGKSYGYCVPQGFPCKQ